MNKGFLSGKSWQRVVFVLLCGLTAPWVMAGPHEETDLAEKEFARGDLVAAMSLWKRVAQQGFAPAQVRLGDMLDKAEEDVEAVDWYRKAAAQGNAAGEDGLGQMYAKGEGVSKDFEQARLYILRAAEKNYLPSVIMMMESYRSGGLGLAADAAKATEWEAKVIALLPTYKRAQPKEVVKTRSGRAK